MDAGQMDEAEKTRLMDSWREKLEAERKSPLMLIAVGEDTAAYIMTPLDRASVIRILKTLYLQNEPD